MSKKVDEIRDTLKRLLNATQNADLETYKPWSVPTSPASSPRPRDIEWMGWTSTFF